MLEVNFKNVYAWSSIGGVIDSCQSPNQQGDLNTKKDQISELPKPLTRTPFSGSRISGDIIQLCVSPGTHNPLSLSRLVSLLVSSFRLSSFTLHPWVSPSLQTYTLACTSPELDAPEAGTGSSDSCRALGAQQGEAEAR